MNSRMIRQHQACRWIGPVFLMMCVLATVPAADAQSFYPNIPDFYQHQKFGPGNNNLEDPNWEAGTNNFGWCFYLSTVNQFFFLKKKGYNSLLLNDVTGPPPKWLPAVNEEAKAMIADYNKSSNLQKQCKASGNPLLKDPLNCILRNRNAGPQLGVNGGLIHQYFYQKGAHVRFLSSDGTKKLIKNTTLFAEMQKYLGAGDSVNLRLGNKVSTELWWAGPKPFEGNFHSVTVAGFDATAGAERIWFSDPDSNPDHNQIPGNTNNNAGWKSNPDQANCGANGAQHTNLQCIRLRRFVGNEQLPVPVNNPPTQKEIDQRYFEAVMQPGLKSLDGSGADFDRYDKTDIVALNIVEIVKGSAKGRGASAPGSLNVFQVTPGDIGATPVDEFWVFPASDDQTITFVDESQLPQGWTADVILQNGMDPWGNARSHGWVHAYTEPGNNYNPLLNKQVLNMSYDTESHLPLAAWDVMFDYQENEANLTVQVFGADPPQIVNQVSPPE